MQEIDLISHAVFWQSRDMKSLNQGCKYNYFLKVFLLKIVALIFIIQPNISMEDLVVTFTREAGGWQTSTFSINREFICSTVTWDNRSSLAWIRYKVLQCYSWVIYTYLLLWMQAVIILLLLSHYESKSLIMFGTTS